MSREGERLVKRRGYWQSAAITGVILGVTFWCAPGQARGKAPRRQVSRKHVTKASWYGREFKNRRTASGVRFDPSKLIGAHRTLPLGTHVRVTDLRAGRSVVIKIVDRGPYKPGRGIDLSYAAARKLGMVERGIARVSVEVVPDPALPPLLVASARPFLAPFPGAIQK
jgi:peptidoglycan lytic transglycosylase